jgi:hypothetical protein
MGLAYTSQDTGTFGLHYAKTVRLSSRNSLTIACSFRLLLSPGHFFTTLNHCCAVQFGRGAQHFVGDEIGIVVDSEECDQGSGTNC